MLAEDLKPTKGGGGEPSTYMGITKRKKKIERERREKNESRLDWHS